MGGQGSSSGYQRARSGQGGGSQALAANATATSTGGGGSRVPSSIENATYEQVRHMSREQLSQLGLGEVTGYGPVQGGGTKFNQDGTLAYATFSSTENVSASQALKYSTESHVRSEFIDWAKGHGESVRSADVDVSMKDGRITRWTDSGKEFFEVTGGTRDVESYIEGHNYHGSQSNTVHVRRWVDERTPKLRFTYTGNKSY